ncbi:Glucose-responsive transcription factor [Lecanora helva]
MSKEKGREHKRPEENLLTPRKIRCDADTETPGTTCSSCRRAGATCDFSRAPQKRGPSKGYIKELAERVNNLEYRTGTAPSVTPGSSEFHFNSMNLEQNANYLTADDPQSRKRPLDSFGTPPGYYDNTQNSLQDFAPRQERTNSDIAVRPDFEVTASQLTRGAQSQSANMNATETYADQINAYYELIHPTLPLLSHTTEMIQQIVQRVPAGLLETFFDALDAAIAALLRVNVEDQIKRACRQVKSMIEYPDYVDDTLSELVYLQALILLVIATDNAGPSCKSYSTSTWLSLAVDRAIAMNLHRPVRSNDSDPLTHRDLGRRAWLILYILDRWHAFGRGGILRVPDASCKLVDSDLALMGETPYHLFRLSRAMGHLFDAISNDPEDLATPIGVRLANALDGQISSVRESVHRSFARMPSMHIACLHLQQVAHYYLRGSDTDIEATVNNVFQIVTLLRKKKGVYHTPFMHHIVGLIAHNLIQISELQLHSGATAALQDLCNSLDTSFFRPHSEKTGWDAAISTSITKRLNNGVGERDGLGQLAEAAIGNTGAIDGTHTGKTDDGTHRSTGDSGLHMIGYLVRLK